MIEPGAETYEVITNNVMHVLRNLEPYSTYRISVMAETDAGVGEAMTIDRNTTLDGMICGVLMSRFSVVELTIIYSD